MAYATYSDVQTRLAQWIPSLSGSTTPTSTQVTTLCAEASAQLDMVLKGAGYGLVPATGANDVTALRGYVADYVAYKSWIIAYGSDNIPTTLQTYLDNWNSLMTALRKGEMTLLDQSSGVGSLGVYTPKVYGVDEDTSDLLRVSWRDDLYG
jgi:hypothetical protein